MSSLKKWRIKKEKNSKEDEEKELDIEQK